MSVAHYVIMVEACLGNVWDMCLKKNISGTTWLWQQSIKVLELDSKQQSIKHLGTTYPLGWGITKDHLFLAFLMLFFAFLRFVHAFPWNFTRVYFRKQTPSKYPLKPKNSLPVLIFSVPDHVKQLHYVWLAHSRFVTHITEELLCCAVGVLGLQEPRSFFAKASVAFF